MSSLQVRGLTKTYGGVHALSDFTANFEPGTISAVVGANGAGKTTLLDCLSGNLRATAGEVAMSGLRIDQLTSDARARRGLARSFQEGELFKGLTVREVISLAVDLPGRGLFSGLFGQRGKARRDTVDAALERFNLAQVADEKLAALSLGMCRVTILSCLHVSNTTVWLLDEPASGLAKAEVDRFGLLLRSVVNAVSDRCIIIVEHDAGLVRATADRLLLLETGHLVADAAKGSPAWDDVLEGRSSFRKRAAGLADLRNDGQRAHRSEPRPAIAANNLHVSYGKFEAVRGVSLEVPVGEIRCLIGTNGAGKSTIMRCLAGILKPTSGTVTLADKTLTRPAHDRVTSDAIVLIAGGKTVFPKLTVEENLRLTRRRAGGLDPLDIFPVLGGKRNQLAATLSGGEQQMLAIARGLQLRPRYLLVDELTLGLAERLVDSVLTVLTEFTRAEQMGILLVEQDYVQALKWSEYSYVLAQGEVIFSGPAADAALRPELFRPVFMPVDA